MSKKIKPVEDTAAAEPKAGAAVPAPAKNPVVGKSFTDVEKQKIEQYDRLEKINGDLAAENSRLQDLCAQYLDEIDRLKAELEQAKAAKLVEDQKKPAPMKAAPPPPPNRPVQPKLPLQRTYANVYRNNSTLGGYSSWN